MGVLPLSSFSDGGGFVFMAGVIQQIDLLVSQISRMQAVKDAGVTGQQIGQEIGKALQQTPAVKKAAADLGAAISSELEKATGRAKMDMTALATSSGEIREVVHPMAEAMSQAALQTTAVGAASRGTAGLVTHLRGAVSALAAEAAGVPGPLGQITSRLLAFSAGGGVALGIAAGLGLIALAWNKITEATRKAREEATKFFEQMKKDNEAALPQYTQLQHKLAETSAQAVILRKEFEELERLRLQANAAGGVDLGNRQKEILALLKEADDGVRRIQQLQRQLLTSEPATLSPGAGHSRSFGAQPTDRLTGATQDERDRKAREAAAQQKRDIEENTRLLEKEAQRQLQIAEEQRGVSAQAQHALADLSKTTIDNLQLQIDEFTERVIAAFGMIPPEEQKVIDAWKAQLAEARVMEPLADEVAAFDHRMEKADFSVIKFKTDWEKVGNTIATVGQGILDLARGMGLLSDRMEKVAQGAISVGRNLAKALSGDPAAILGVAAGAVSFIGGAFGFHKSKDPERLAQNQAWYEAAVEGDANALEQLRIHSQVSRGGSAGWGSPAAAADAKAKYDAAMKASAPGRAASAADAAAQAEQDRLDQIRQGEERQVSARTEAERRANIQTLLASGGPQDLTDKLQKLEQEFERLVAASPLGEDSPLARDAKQRADDAAQELDRAVADAKRAAGDQITPGFTVQRTITESSAGRVVGELITSNVWLEKIFGALTGVGPGAAASGVSAGTNVYVTIDGQVLEQGVSVRQSQRVQNQQALNGNASLPS